MRTLWKVLTRRKVLTPDATQETPLARVLNTFDLTALGVGSTLGVGVYVLAGQVAKNIAGPAVIISFLIAAVASVFAGLCYAEFGARAPRAGSAYIYSYLCVGEFIAFVIGWNLILEYIIGSASVAKGMSSYIDNICNGILSRTFLEIAPINLPYLSPYFDIFAFVVPVLLSMALAFGMKESSLVNNIFTTLNICVVLFVIIAGSFNAHLSNWFIDPNDVKNVTNGTNIGRGGFFPFGVDGVIKGAATCFYGFVGFDCIATTGEEVKNPKKAIPISIVLSLSIIFLAYFGVSTVVTLMVPYYEQDPTAPIPYAFQSIHWHTAALIVSIGAIFGLYASLFGAMFPLPRILYAMATDGLIFRLLGQVNERFKTPIIGTLCAGLFTGIMAALFDLEALVNMMSIGTLLAYTIVAASVLLLRYSEDEKTSYAPLSGSSDSEDIEGYSDSPTNDINDSDENVLTENKANLGVMTTIFNCGKTKVPDKKSQLIVSIDICLYCILCFLLGLCALHLKKEIMNREIIPLTGISVILFLMVLTILSILSQPLSRKVLSFQVPWVPLIPAVSILCNIYLMIMLDIATWIRFVVWMILGILIFYFARRNISKNHKMVATETSNQDYSNKNFFDEDLENMGSSDFNDPFFEPIMINHGGKPILVDDPQNNGDFRILTPSKVIESLDLVLDSFIGDLASPDVMSVENLSFASNVALVQSSNLQNDNYRGTQNTVLRDKLLDALNIDYESVNLESAVVNPTYIFEQNQLNENNCESVDKYIEVQNECNTISASTAHSEIVEKLDDNLSHGEFIENEHQFSNMGDEDDDYSTDGVRDEKKVHLSNMEAISIDKCHDKDSAFNLDDGSLHVSKLSNVDDVQKENIFSPPPPPVMPDFNSFSCPVNDKLNIHNSDIHKDDLIAHENSDQRKNNSFVTINSESLGSVKLRHVERSSLEKIVVGANNSEGDRSCDTTKNESDEIIFTPPESQPITNYNNTASQEEKERSILEQVLVPIGEVRIEHKITLPAVDESSLKLVKLRHVSRPSLEKKFSDTEDTVQKSYSLPDTPILGQSSRKTTLSKNNDISEKERPLDTRRRMEISKDAINALKLRPIELSSANKRDQYKKPDSVRFGSLEFEQFKSQLNEKLKNPSLSRVSSFLDPKRVHTKNDIKVKNENVIEDSIDKEKAKATIQFQIESKLSVLNNLKAHEHSKNNLELKDHLSETFNYEPNVQKETVCDVDERSPVEMKN